MLLKLLLIVGCVLVLTLMAQLICAWIDSRKFPPPGRIVSIPAGHMHVRHMGAGQPAVVLEAGMAASTLNWTLVQAPLSALTSTYSYDRAGFGWSTARDSSCSLTRIVEDLHAMLAALNVTAPYILVGHSFAGLIIGEYSRRFARELAGVVLIDPLTPEEWIEPTHAQRWMLRRGVWFSRIGALLAAFGVVRMCLWLLQRGDSEAPRGVLAFFGSKATETVERILRELIKLPPDVVRLIRARWSTPRFFLTMAGYIGSVPRCSTEVLGRAIPAAIPVTVISGAHQLDVRRQEHAAIVAHSAQGRHLMADKGAHWIHLDQPELVTQAVHDLLASLGRRAVEAPK